MNITWLIQVCVFLGLIAYRIKKKNVEEKKDENYRIFNDWFLYAGIKDDLGAGAWGAKRVRRLLVVSIGLSCLHRRRT